MKTCCEPYDNHLGETVPKSGHNIYPLIQKNGKFSKTIPCTPYYWMIALRAKNKENMKPCFLVESKMLQEKIYYGLLW